VDAHVNDTDTYADHDSSEAIAEECSNIDADVDAADDSSIVVFEVLQKIALGLPCWDGSKAVMAFNATGKS